MRCMTRKQALHALAPQGISLSACTDDVMLMAYIAAVSESDFSFDKLTQRMLGTTASSLAERAYDTRKLYEELSAILDKTEQTELYRKIEFPLCRVLFEIEREGFTVDVPGAARFFGKAGRHAERVRRTDLSSGGNGIQHQFAETARRGAV